MVSLGGRSRKGFLLLNPGDVAGGGAIFVGLVVGNAARTGVVALLLPDEFLTRNGFVSEFEVELGSKRVGAGSSKGDINAIRTQCQ